VVHIIIIHMICNKTDASAIVAINPADQACGLVPIRAQGLSVLTKSGTGDQLRPVLLDRAANKLSRRCSVQNEGALPSQVIGFTFDFRSRARSAWMPEVDLGPTRPPLVP
jgi:hypothetical protein